MPPCRFRMLLLLVTAAVVVAATKTAAFLVPQIPPQKMSSSSGSTTTLLRAESRPEASTPTTTMVVEVCGFKDCKRAGGGPRLQKFIGSILEEKELTDAIQVEACDCQGECGYGPNLVVDGRLINNVKGREAVLKALGINEEES